MAKKRIIDVRLYVGPGDFEPNEVQVYIYLPLTIPKSRCRIRIGSPEGEHVAMPLNYSIQTKDVLEYMTRNEDLAYLLLKLMEADVLRGIRREEKLKGKTDEEILEILLKKKEKFEEREKRYDTDIKRFTKLPIVNMVNKVKELIIEEL